MQCSREGELNVYADAMSTALSSRGISVAAEDVPTQDAVDADVQQLRDWLSSLDGARKGILKRLGESP